MMFKKSELYKHKEGRDVAIFIMDSKEETSGVSLKVMWVNVHYNELGLKEPFPITDQQKVFIHRNKVNDWLHYDAKAHKGVLKS